MRVFLAIEIEDYIKDKIKSTQDIIYENNSAKIKYVETENIHLTLKFFGEINENKLEKIKNIISSKIENHKPYTLKIVNIGAFPNISRPRVIWTGIKDNDNSTINLIKELDEEFSKIGFEKEKRYTPHITIGRVKDIYNKENTRQTLEKIKKNYHGKMEVKKIALKSSKLTPSGPIYDTIKEYKL